MATKTVNPYAFTSNPYTLRDMGSYYNHGRGPAGVLAFAGHHGMPEAKGCEPCDLEQATDYMNEHYAVEGARWGRIRCGCWGLWAS